MNAYLLEVTYESGKSKSVPIQCFPFWIGRDRANDLVLSDPIVSRRHALIQQIGGHLSIVDNQSRNGVMVNDEPISNQQEMRPGDRIAIGPYMLRFGSDHAVRRHGAVQGHTECRLFPGTWRRSGCQPDRRLLTRLRRSQVTTVGEVVAFAGQGLQRRIV